MSTSETGGYFTTPPAAGADVDFSTNKVYNLGSTVPVEWYTSLSEITITLFQQNSGSPEAANRSLSATLYSDMETSTTKANSFNWMVSLSYPGTVFNTTPSADIPGNVFFLAVTNTNGSMGFTSHYFNITNSTTTSSTLTSITTSISSSTQGPTTSPTSTQTAGPENGSSGLTAGQQAGIGVGVSLAALLAIIAFIWFSRSRRPKSRLQPVGANTDFAREPGPPTVPVEKMSHGKDATELKGERHMHHQELPGQDATQELAGQHATQELPVN